ncbi:DUF6603 domain-containing protein [Intrasporangium sp.]|uniref:DUF6603 domain-containing protein n=1 Tax=Intrasporangium sp. TaxID=1925024 RepID=UPI00293AEF99|nr:DUF6603 domain-containing protein [Intrasporangium sp.]MDV3220317.1 hypothetical protein [Intrasporangium sp.]
MADQPGTVDVIARELASALIPLQERLAPEAAPAFLGELGLNLPSGFATAATAIGGAAVKAGALAPLVADLVDAIDGEDAEAIVAAAAPLLGAIADVVEAISALEPALDAAVAAAPGLTTDQRSHLAAEAAALPGRLLEWMLVEYLETRSAGVYTALTLLGLVDDAIEPGVAGDPTRPPVRRRALFLDRIVTMLTAPQDYLSAAFRFGEPGFDAMELFVPLATYLESLDLAVDIITPPSGPPILEAYVVRLSTDPSSSPPAFTADLRVPATQDVTFTLPLGDRWSLSFTSAARFDAGIGAVIRYPLELTITPPSGSVGIDLDLGLQAENPSGPMMLLGAAGSSRLELQRFATSLGLSGSAGVGQPVSIEPRARLELAGGRLVIDFSQADGFIGAVASGFGIDANLDLAALWSPSTGLQVEGSGGLEIAVPTHISLGPIEITALYLQVSIEDQGGALSLPIELSGAFSANLGPLEAAVDRIGVLARLTFPPEGGNLGPLDLGFEFKPPNGVGLSIDAGVVRGGGYLYIDTERGEYAGVLELDIAEIVSVKAIGLITTRMPDGSDGFSLLIVITAEFGTGLQLGFGFTLLGVGGILGLNRTMNLPALVEGVRTNAIASVMFPQDVVANAQRIISDLRAFFPPQEGIFLIGPMAKIGWGTPTLASLSLGIVIEIPGNIAIVGILRVALPADDVAVIVLQVNFVGAIEFDKERVYFFAAIYDSRILYLTIEGEMAVLADFGGDAVFVLSVGGFHPDFDPPPLPVPVPNRIAVSIVDLPWAMIRVEGYFAVTSNSAQFGARLDLRFGFDDFGITGQLAFDALFIFSPFSFIVAISGAVSLRVFGFDVFTIRLSLALSGPTPWRARGTGSLSLLFWDIDVDFDETFGDAADSSLPGVDVLPLLVAEYDKLENWRTLLPANASPLVSLRELDPLVDTLVLHPVGTLQVTQRLVPLDQSISRLGNAKAQDVTRLALEVDTSELAKQGDVLESFAPAQFNDLKDAERLSRKSFEPGHGGIELSAAGETLRTGPLVRRVVRYELITVDTGWLRARRQRFQVVLSGLFQFFLRGAAVSRNPLSQYQQTLAQPFAEKVQAGPEQFAVASAVDNSVIATFTNESQARDYLADQVAGGAGAATLHVVPAFEAVG